ncbi:MAG: hypothetical protein H0V73_07395 [Chloroflexi bacterium]|nr:hypothetical protein [Chloroflexota bacterium]
MHSHYLFLALDLARERAAEADADRLASLAHPGEPRGAGIRRAIARIAIAIARAADDEVGQVPQASH